MSSAQEEAAIVTEVSAAAAGSKKDGASSKKETFQWSTPADEFADDVESDNEDDHDYLASDMDEVVGSNLH